MGTVGKFEALETLVWLEGEAGRETGDGGD